MGLGNTLMESNVLLVATAILLVAAAGAGWIIVRAASRRRIAPPGSARTALPRLGIVEAFDLDRRRQLLIVRCDDVEHLILVGGPNDLLIESEISRPARLETQTRDARAEAETAMPQAAGFAIPARGVEPARPDVAASPLRTQEQIPAAAIESAIGARLSDEALSTPSRQSPVFPIPARRMPPAVTSTQKPPQIREPAALRTRLQLQPRADDKKRDTPTTTPATGGASGPPANAFLRRSFPRNDQAAASTAPHDLDAPRPEARPPTSRGPLAADEITVVAPPPTPAARDGETAETMPAPAPVRILPDEKTADVGAASGAIDRLEAEMAQLLGRSPSQ